MSAMIGVAPFTGARIETCYRIYGNPLTYVAPFTGARIETRALVEDFLEQGAARFTGAAQYSGFHYS